MPPEPRLPRARRLIEQASYFVVHAPRQTTTLRALASAPTAEGKYAAIHFSCEAAEAMGEDVDEGLRPPKQEDAPPGDRVGRHLSRWARACPRPIVLFMDEIDAVQGKSLRAVLRQIRAGYDTRVDGGFPWAIGLCGLCDLPPSPYNIKTESFRVADFTQVRALHAQLTANTGQAFTEDSLRAIELTAGQPWLVNALAREVVESMEVPATTPIKADHIEEAKERLILARHHHLDSLAAKLQEARVRRIGRGCIDLLIRWPYPGPDGKRAWQREAIELKVCPVPTAQGLEQLDAYLERLGLDHGVLVVFERRPEAPPVAERTQIEVARSKGNHRVTILRA